MLLPAVHLFSSTNSKLINKKFCRKGKNIINLTRRSNFLFIIVTLQSAFLGTRETLFNLFHYDPDYILPLNISFLTDEQISQLYCFTVIHIYKFDNSFGQIVLVFLLLLTSQFEFTFIFGLFVYCKIQPVTITIMILKLNYKREGRGGVGVKGILTTNEMSIYVSHFQNGT